MITAPNDQHRSTDSGSGCRSIVIRSTGTSAAASTPSLSVFGRVGKHLHMTCVVPEETEVCENVRPGRRR